MTKQKESPKGQPTALNGIQPITAQDMTEAEYDMLYEAKAEDGIDGLRVLTSENVPPDDLEYSTRQEAARLLATPSILKLERQERYPDGTTYDLYLITDAGRALYNAASEVIIQQEQTVAFLDAVHNGDSERAAFIAGRLIAAMPPPPTLAERIQQLGELSEVEQSWLTAVISALEGLRLQAVQV